MTQPKLTLSHAEIDAMLGVDDFVEDISLRIARRRVARSLNCASKSGRSNHRPVTNAVLMQILNKQAERF